MLVCTIAVASLLSCLHQLRAENLRLEEHVSSLLQRRDHLLAVNARLAIPLTGQPSTGQPSHPHTGKQNVLEKCGWNLLTSSSLIFSSTGTLVNVLVTFPDSSGDSKSKPLASSVHQVLHQSLEQHKCRAIHPSKVFCPKVGHGTVIASKKLLNTKLLHSKAFRESLVGRLMRYRKVSLHCLLTKHLLMFSEQYPSCCGTKSR